MNLLEAIVAWDEGTVRAVASGHRDAAHPLRRAGELPIACGIEYGAQAAAAHGALVAGAPSGAGFLASVRAVRFHARRLDDIEGSLEIFAEQAGGGEGGVLYRFEVTAGGRALIEGRLAVAFVK
jgi:predicted hotdog family 3-hydroxylacyl-ACP dehydratase